VDFKGEEFKVLIPSWSLYTDYYFTDETNGDTMNDTIYERTKLVEEAIKVDITFNKDLTYNQVYSTLAPLVLAGDDVYDLAFTHNSSGFSSLLTAKMIQNWYDIPNINFEAPHWSQSCEEAMTVNGIYTLSSSSLVIPDINSLFYNKEMHKNYSLEAIYPVISEGEWTWDKLIEMSEKVTADLNGDGTMDEKDQYGYLGEFSWQLASITTSNDQYIMKKNDAGVNELTINTEKMANVVEKMHYLFKESGLAYTWAYKTEYDPNNGGTPPVSFDGGHGLFYMVPLSLANYFRNTEADFGIIPLPKYDEAQDDYVSLNWAGFMVTPITATNIEMTGLTMELLSYHNDKLVMPVFYDVLLGQKIARDDESVEMLDLIFDGAVYDLGVNLTQYNFLRYPIEQGGVFASYYASNESSAKAKLNSYVESYEGYGE
nr:extracellular solute-binding protein [Clostridia bacterium]